MISFSANFFALPTPFRIGVRKNVDTQMTDSLTSITEEPSGSGLLLLAML
jgi:hypothetical protein